MSTTDIIAILALVIASGSFALELKRWFDQGPKLHLSLIADAVMVPDDDGRDKLFLTVTNRGDVPTLVTHMIVYVYDDWLRYLRGKRSMQGVVNSTIQAIPSVVPVNGTFKGMLVYNEELKEARERKRLYVGVICSHSSRDFLIRVPKRVVRADTIIEG